MVTWRDIIKVLATGEVFGIEYEIDPEPESKGVHNCDRFFEALEKEYGLSHDEDCETLMFDRFDITGSELEKVGYGIESCGVVINGEVF